MKIGIITVYSVDYGSYFQAYALYNYLLNMGHECELINESVRWKYSPKFKYAVKMSRFLPSFIKEGIADKIHEYRVYLDLQKNIKKLKVSEECRHMETLSSKYDCIIIGADEVWSATNPKIGFIEEYWGIHMNCPVLSYATSGVTLKNPSDELISKMKNSLSNLRSIAVRDQVTAEWVGKLLNRNIDIVLDPTLLNPCFEGRENYPQDYILVYGEHFSQEQIEAIKEFAKKENMPLKSVSWKHTWCDKYLRTDSAEELQDYFKSCHYVITSTFHGTIFSIVNKKNFTSFITEMRGTKVKLLLEQLGLENHIFTRKIIEEKVDYDSVEKVLQEQRQESKEYLINALKKIESNLKK